MPEGPEVKIASDYFNEFFLTSKEIEFEIISEYYNDKYAGIFNTVKNQDVLKGLREHEAGVWKKVYSDGYASNGAKVSIHYFQSQSGKVFDVKVKNGWSNK